METEIKLKISTKDFDKEDIEKKVHEKIKTAFKEGLKDENADMFGDIEDQVMKEGFGDDEEYFTDLGEVNIEVM